MESAGDDTAVADTAADPVGPQPVSLVRASHAERGAAADRLHIALGEGRLDLSETEERLAAAYAARYRCELLPLLAELPWLDKIAQRDYFGAPVGLAARAAVEAAAAELEAFEAEALSREAPMEPSMPDDSLPDTTPADLTSRSSGSLTSSERGARAGGWRGAVSKYGATVTAAHPGLPFESTRRTPLPLLRAAPPARLSATTR